MIKKAIKKVYNFFCDKTMPEQESNDLIRSGLYFYYIKPTSFDGEIYHRKSE
jgi:hypothetical protein